MIQNALKIDPGAIDVEIQSRCKRLHNFKRLRLQQYIARKRYYIVFQDLHVVESENNEKYQLKWMLKEE
jgi:hypothetical protein